MQQLPWWRNCKRNYFGIIKRIDNESWSPHVANFKVDVSNVSSLQEQMTTGQHSKYQLYNLLRWPA